MIATLVSVPLEILGILDPSKAFGHPLDRSVLR
jgi:hypothetical protein